MSALHPIPLPFFLPLLLLLLLLLLPVASSISVRHTIPGKKLCPSHCRGRLTRAQTDCRELPLCDVQPCMYRNNRPGWACIPSAATPSPTPASPRLCTVQTRRLPAGRTTGPEDYSAICLCDNHITYSGSQFTALSPSAQHCYHACLRHAIEDDGRCWRAMADYEALNGIVDVAIPVCCQRCDGVVDIVGGSKHSFYGAGEFICKRDISPLNFIL